MSLEEKYKKEVVPVLAKEFAIKNRMAVPRVEKVVLNIGIGKLLKNKEAVETLKKDVAKITGQNPSLRRAKISVASFSIRSGMVVGMAVTLRGKKMYAFLDRLFSVVLPRLRDFRGVAKKSFDKNGNYSLGFTEHTVFPEIDSVKSSPFGMEITIVTSTQNREAAEKLLSLLGLRFEK